MLYKNTGDIPIHNFDKILRGGDYRYMLRSWNEYEEVLHMPIETKNVWREIYDSYCQKTVNNESLTYYALCNEVSHLETRLAIVIILIENITEENKKAYGKELNAWGIAFNIDGNIKDQLPRIKKQLKTAKQKYEIRKNKLDNLKSDEEPTSLLKQKIRLERITGIKINTRECVVDEWIEINNEAKEISEASKKNG